MSGVWAKRILPTIWVHICSVAHVSRHESKGSEGQQEGRSRVGVAFIGDLRDCNDSLMLNERSHFCLTMLGRLGAKGNSSKTMISAEFARNIYRVVMLSVHSFIHGSHIIGCNSASECVEGCADLGPSLEGVSSHQRHGLIRREVMAIVLKGGQIEGLDRSVC